MLRVSHNLSFGYTILIPARIIFCVAVCDGGFCTGGGGVCAGKWMGERGRRWGWLNFFCFSFSLGPHLIYPCRSLSCRFYHFASFLFVVADSVRHVQLLFRLIIDVILRYRLFDLFEMFITLRHSYVDVDIPFDASSMPNKGTQQKNYANPIHDYT